MLPTYNLNDTVHLPTRITNGSISAICNTFIDKARNHTISPFIIGMSGHDAQLITLSNVFL
jgi:hypothetical protein